MKYVFSCIVFLGFLVGGQAQSYILQFHDAQTGAPISGAMIYSDQLDEMPMSGMDGRITLSIDSAVSVICMKEGYQTDEILLSSKDSIYKVNLTALQIKLDEVMVTEQYESDFNSTKLQNVDGFGIYAAKKSELINLNKLLTNKASNVAREVYSSVPGLNIWENDGSGLQLNIGARGLNPNRSAHFNTRQNGYDISADALGYPESYYTPPLQAIENIQMVRGAASLQFGPQFGGLINFQLKEGPRDQPFEFYSENTLGSFGMFSTYNSIGGQKGNVNYYGYLSYKTGKGWRENENFDQWGGYGMIDWKITEKWDVKLEQTAMKYLAQQPGGLVDFQFNQNPRQSLRDRNWFSVNWMLSALTTDYRFSDHTAYNGRFFFLHAGRKSLGDLSPVNRPDPGRERELIDGSYKNLGHESRIIHRYTIGNQLATLLTGVRVYRGQSNSDQGLGNDGDKPHFQFLNPKDLETASYSFPSWNTAVFAEHLFNIKNGWTLTPGVRFEFIHTAMDGYYKQRVLSGNEVIVNKRFNENKSNGRSFALLGLGIAKKLNNETEAYLNFSQNYRSINFTDLAIINPSLKVDKSMKDEQGFNADLGVRGYLWEKMLRFDLSLFYLRYNDRIGISYLTENDPRWGDRLVTYRTNVGDARVWGIESYLEADFVNALNIENKAVRWHGFLNLSMLDGKYISGGTDVTGKEIENVPPFNLKTGLQFSWKRWSFKYQYNLTQQHYSDATNSIQVADATRGIIPTYSVMDTSMSFHYKNLLFQTGMNNLLDKHYFTRRALSYPGPGIIPAPGRSMYLTVGITL
ncbi:TonB-dependent receptor [Membranicola marinus]|uniref:TonB-dependent receptor n=1 Tax=Membranihabitans marinus TaxID=1227546 RepID=A0A953LCR9_9BACT|nr:TonB-dependent receptor plug domain-containing protein [Membranihabitans marinus]MBY5958079.1 TonB-dependent receptor [Membranihabitans marinus]